MVRLMIVIAFVALFAVPAFSWTAIQKYMMCPNSITNDVWGYNVVAA
ncbi:MAG TPA: hypothetical protein PK875_11205 [Spirochaetota bacterium]|nr:hypothetical protein [Spirochaetota bacterium]HPO46348.1 hypothetical protein [Spirochaetota bacterium]